jgi:lipoprotein-anchoring transpeptidase ErfK/SrfK
MEPAASAKRPAPPASPVAVTAGHRGGCGRSLIGTLASSNVAAHTLPTAGSNVVARFHRRSVEGGPQVFALEGSFRGGRWFRALLPVRPNGTTGYLPARALRLSATPYRIVVDRARFRLGLFRGCSLVRTFRVGVGKPSTPTPAGSFYVTALLRPRRTGTVYGAYAFGLSAFSSVIRSWRWGGVIGLHGTNEPGSVGRGESHGCIRMRNADIASLARILPLGTPVTIR